jgi:Flp pilus assembly protein protease CpaA
MFPGAIARELALALAAISAISDVRSGCISNAILVPAILTALALAFANGCLGWALMGVLSCGVYPFYLAWKDRLGGADLKLFMALGGFLGPFIGLLVEGISFLVLSLLPTRIQRPAAPAILVGVLLVRFL